MRKIAEREASGVSAVDALLEAVGLQRGELESLRKRLELAAGEATQWREKAEHELAQIAHLKEAVAERNKETAQLRAELHKASDAQQYAAQQSAAQIASLTALLGDRDKQLASSLSLSGLDVDTVLAVTTLRDRLAKGEMRLHGTADETKRLIANLDRPEMRALSQLLERGGWQLHILRWLLPRS